MTLSTMGVTQPYGLQVIMLRRLMVLPKIAQLNRGDGLLSITKYGSAPAVERCLGVGLASSFSLECTWWTRHQVPIRDWNIGAAKG